MSHADKSYSTSVATRAQVRHHYKSLGLQIKISNGGHVRFRDKNCIAKSPWQDGRWISEYRATETEIVLS